LDGSAHLLTPEKAVEIQEALGSDIAMILDECIPHDATRDYVERSTARTIRWAQRCSNARSKAEQMMFGIIQGGLFEDLRRACVNEMACMAFEGFAVGGLAVGESEEQLNAVSSFTAQLLPEDKPRYLMGVGRPQDIINGVRAGFDMFDCVIPTRNARNGTLFTWQGKLNIKRAEYAGDARPLDETCGCYCCRNFSRAYLRHLYMAGEILSSQLNTLHNLYFYHRLMDKCREAIRDGVAERWPQWLVVDAVP
jgi:queuine tRNA-ribosyltransferase